MGTIYTTDLIPIMTSDTTPSGTASASSINSIWNPWRAMSDSTSQYWRSSTGTNEWIAYEFTSSVIISRYTMLTSLSITTEMPNTWTFEGYNGATWDTLDSQSGITWSSSEKKEFTFTNSTSYTKYRINVSTVNGGSNVRIAEIEMIKAIDYSDTSETLPTVTGTDELGSSTLIRDWADGNGYMGSNFVERDDGKLLLGYSKESNGTHYVSWIDEESGLGTDDITTNETSFGSGFDNGTYKQYDDVYTKSLVQFFKSSTGKLMAFTLDPGVYKEASGAGTAGLPSILRYHESSNGLGIDFGSGTQIYSSDSWDTHNVGDSGFFSRQYVNVSPPFEKDGIIFVVFGGTSVYRTGTYKNYWFGTKDLCWSDDDGATWNWTTIFRPPNDSTISSTIIESSSGIFKAGNLYIIPVNVRDGSYYKTVFYYADSSDFYNWYVMNQISDYHTMACFTSLDGYSYWFFHQRGDGATDLNLYRRLASSALDPNDPFSLGAGNTWEQYSSSTTYSGSFSLEYTLFDSPSGQINLTYKSVDQWYYHTTDRSVETGKPYEGDYIIEINDTDYTFKADSKTVRWTNYENFSNTADALFIDDTNFVKMGMELIIRRKSDSKIVFGGLIQEPKKILLSPEFLAVKVHAESYKQILGRRTFELNVQNQLAGTTIQGIFDDYLKVGGTYTDEELTLGNIDSGITIESYVKRAQSGLKLFNDLADASDYKWWITNEKEFYFQANPTYTDNTTTKKLTPNKSDSAYINCIDLPDFNEDSSKFRTRQNVIGKKIDGVFVFGSYTDSTAETEMASRYGSGVFGSVMVNDNISTTAEADALAQSEVETYVNPSKIRFKTTDFIEPLELIKVDISILGISDETYKVTSVSYAFDNDVRIVCDVTCEKYQLANKPKRTWTDEFNEMMKENAKQGDEDDYSYNDNAGIVNLAPAVPYLNTITHILDKDRALHCHYSIVGVSTGAGTVTVTFDINTVVQKTFTFDVVAGNFSKTLAYPIRGIATSGSATVDASTTSTVAIAIAINDLNFWVHNK